MKKHGSSNEIGTAKLKTHRLCQDYAKLLRQRKLGEQGLQLVAVYEMINIFAATGDLNYAWSRSLHLELMLELPDTNPQLQFVVDEMHTARQGDRFTLAYGEIQQQTSCYEGLEKPRGITRRTGFAKTVRTVHMYHMNLYFHLYLTAFDKKEINCITTMHFFLVF